MSAPPDPLPPDLLQDAAATFGLLSATVRLHLLWLLAHDERDVGTLAEETGQSVATVSHHLGKLKLAGLVRARRHGKHQIHYIDDPHVVDIVRLAVQHHRELRPGSPRARHTRGA
ncbi:helix-turn-helix transcriptional regulator [Amycolatopsis sp. MtRt-6]|uniref:ArsR/SmtB family transcription factor n=1 Tax=Amycolatopsis sp. MtRt-6 TaxID=2792782 RepID=UPI001A8C4F01|nr:metalloregulator ArsR/SmtB family transcription factor [Amycolatopsis sp. MtRt-6]